MCYFRVNVVPKVFIQTFTSDNVSDKFVKYRDKLTLCRIKTNYKKIMISTYHANVTLLHVLHETASTISTDCLIK